MNHEQKIEALEREFERLVERQTVLHELLADGNLDVWLSTKRIGTRDYTLVIDSAAGEARQGATAMATILRTLAQLKGTEASNSMAPDPLAKMEDELAAKRATKAQ